MSATALAGRLVAVGLLVAVGAVIAGVVYLYATGA